MKLLHFSLLGLLLVLPGSAADILAVVRPQRSQAVDFRREVLPLLQANCLPCHNKTTTKADLLLETPADMLKGGENGPAIVAGKAAESLLMKLSTHAEKPRMPPRDNKVNAVNFTPEQLGLIARWIDEGAHDSEGAIEVVRWLPNAPEIRSIYAVAMTPDAQYLAAGWGNRLFLFHRPTGQAVTELTAPTEDSSGKGAPAHRDQVSSVAFRPDGQQLVSGGFKELKFWKRVDGGFQKWTGSTDGLGTQTLLKSADGFRSLKLDPKVGVKLLGPEGKVVAALEIEARAAREIRHADLELSALRSRQSVTQRRFETAEKEQKSQSERLGRAKEALIKAVEALKEPQKARDKAAEDLKAAETALAQLKPDAKQEDKKAAKDRVDSAKKPVEETQKLLETAQRKKGVAEDEVRLAEASVEQSNKEVQLWKGTRSDLGLRLTAVEQQRSNVVAQATTVPVPTLVALSLDARWVVTVVGGTVSIWSGSSGEAIDTWDAPGPVTALGFGPQQTLLLRTGDTVYARNLLPRWEFQTLVGGETHLSPLMDRVGALTYSPDGKVLASASGEPSRSGDIQFWDPHTIQFLGSTTNLHSDTIFSLAYSPDGKSLVSGGADRFARLVDPQTRKQIRALEGHTGHVLAVGWKEDDSTVASAGADLSLKFWDALTGEKRKQASGLEREITALAFLKDDHWVATGNPRELRVINENGDRIRGLTGLKDLPYALATSKDGKWIAAGGQEGVLRIWNRDSESPLLEWDAFKEKQP